VGCFGIDQPVATGVSGSCRFKKMKDIQELAYIIKQLQLKVLNPTGQPMDRDTILYRFYQGLERGEFATDEGAEKVLYPEGASAAKYRRLKSTLRDRMLSAIAAFEANGNDFSDYQRAYYTCHRDWLTVKILIGQNANTAAIGQAIRLLKEVQRYEFTMLTMDIAAYLAYQFGLRESNDKKFREANELYTNCRLLIDAECMAEQFYMQLMVKVVNQLAPNKEVATLAEEYYQQIAGKMHQFSSYKLYLYGNMINMMRYSAINQFEAVLPICNDAIAFFEKKPFEARVPLQMFYYQKLLCLIQLRQFEESREVAKRCINLTNEGNFNWFKYKELYLKLTFYSQNYSEGAHIIKAVLSHTRFDFLPDSNKELWKIYESYSYLLAKMGKIDGLSTNKFKLNKFVNETRIFSKDKSGMNVAIIVLKTMYLLVERRYDQILDDVVGIERYCSRYLSNQNSLRSSNFIKMLLQIPLGQFDAILVEKRAKRYFKGLDKNPRLLHDQTYEVEIIPYETLWELALEILRKESS
jgi:hypothetical protein